MKFQQIAQFSLATAVLLSILLCSNQSSIATGAEVSGSFSAGSDGGGNGGGGNGGGGGGGGSGGGIISKGIGGLVGAASGAIAGGVAGANAGAEAGANGGGQNGGGGISADASFNAGSSGGSGGSGGSASGSISASGSGSGSGSGFSGSGSGGSGGGMSASGSASMNSGSGSASASASLNVGSTTAKPEGLLGKVKEIIKSSVEVVTGEKKEEKKEDKKVTAGGSINLGPIQASGSINLNGSGGSGGSGGISGSGSISGGSSGSNNSGSGSSGEKGSGGGLLSKLFGGTTSSPSLSMSGYASLNSKSSDYGSDYGSSYGGSSGSSGSSGSGGGGLSMSASANAQAGSNSGSGSGASGSASMSMSMGGSTQRPEGGIIDKISDVATKGKEKLKDIIYGDYNEDGKREGPIDKVQKAVSKVSEPIRETLHRIEDKAQEVENNIEKTMDEHIYKPMNSVSGSGYGREEGQLTAHASFTANVRGQEREKYLRDAKRRQEMELGREPKNLREVIDDAKRRGVIPMNEDRSVLHGNRDDEKGVAIEVFDKAHELSKIPVESVLKPIDKMLGFEKDPLVRFYDNGHEFMRRKLDPVVKPLETLVTGAFKTTDETKRDQERLLSTLSEQERREARISEEKQRREDRSVVGNIADKTVELVEKPFEVILKPIDHVFGFDKDGKKNPILHALDEIYGLSKKPVDAIVKPFESILKKMAEGEQSYQVSIRFSEQLDDPKLFTRLADGALNIADRVITKPLEVVMKPLDKALGYDDIGKRNPIVEAAHSLKNATRNGFELFTRPIDRIIKEIAEIGAIKDDAEREMLMARKHEEASRLVNALDRFHKAVQSPFEIVLRPMGKALGTNKDGRKDSLLRAWDIIHEVLRTPIQVISKPLEDAILGEQTRRQPSVRARVEAQANGNSGSGSGGASFSARAQVGGQSGGQIGGGRAGVSASYGRSEPPRRNFIVDGIRRVETIATRPIEVITSPIRRLILGEDDAKVGTQTEKNNREIQAKSRGNQFAAQGQYQQGPDGVWRRRPDKIITTIQNMNNVVLKPIELVTQPLSDLLTGDLQINQQQQPQQQQQQQHQQHQQQQHSGQNKGGFQVSLQGSAQTSQGGSQQQQMSASAQASIKKRSD